MYTGKMTPELERLYDEYYALFQIFPFGHEELEYSQRDYEDYVRDIKKAIEEKKELPEVADYEEGDW